MAEENSTTAIALIDILLSETKCGDLGQSRVRLGFAAACSYRGSGQYDGDQLAHGADANTNANAYENENENTNNNIKYDHKKRGEYKRHARGANRRVAQADVVSNGGLPPLAIPSRFANATDVPSLLGHSRSHYGDSYLLRYGTSLRPKWR